MFNFEVGDTVILNKDAPRLLLDLRGRNLTVVCFEMCDNMPMVGIDVGQSLHYTSSLRGKLSTESGLWVHPDLIMLISPAPKKEIENTRINSFDGRPTNDDNWKGGLDLLR